METSEGGELLASYISRADGLLEQVTDGTGTVTKYQYNQKKQVTGLTVTAADGTVQYRETNTYDRNGSLLTQSISGAGYGTESLSYTYDELDRLLSETKNGKTTSYTYDSMGNRLTKTADGVTTSYVYDLCNKLLSETTGEEVATYSYDELGNLTTKTGAEGTTTYAYDALNQLAEVVNPDGTWQKNTYDASGIRSMITENGITTEFMTFNGMVVSGYNKHGEQTEHYYYGNSLVAVEYIVPSATPEAGYGEDTEGLETSLYYYLKNSHGDVIGLTNNTGTLTETYRYNAFGTLTKIQSLNENGVLAQTDTAQSRFLYAGEQYDKVTGLYYLRARQYDTLTGRFTQEDTYLGDGRNLYAYVSGNPLKYVDPSGHGKQDEDDEEDKNKFPNPIGILPWLLLPDGSILPDIDINLPSFGILHDDVLDLVDSGGNAESIYESVNNTGGVIVGEHRGGGRSGGGERGGSGRAGYGSRSETNKMHSRSMDSTGEDRKVVANRSMDSTGENRKVVANRNMDSIGENRKGMDSTNETDFYVTPSGIVIPAKGYRYMSREASYMPILEKTMKIPANSNGTYITFDKFDIPAPEMLQVPHDASIRGTFDTLQIIDDIRIPHGKWGEADWLEPITKDFPEYGPGGATQAITDLEIILDFLEDLLE